MDAIKSSEKFVQKFNNNQEITSNGLAQNTDDKYAVEIMDNEHLQLLAKEY